MGLIDVLVQVEVFEPVKNDEGDVDWEVTEDNHLAVSPVSEESGLVWVEFGARSDNRALDNRVRVKPEDLWRALEACGLMFDE